MNIQSRTTEAPLPVLPNDIWATIVELCPLSSKRLFTPNLALTCKQLFNRFITLYKESLVVIDSKNINSLLENVVFLSKCRYVHISKDITDFNQLKSVMEALKNVLDLKIGCVGETLNIALLTCPNLKKLCIESGGYSNRLFLCNVQPKLRSLEIGNQGEDASSLYMSDIGTQFEGEADEFGNLRGNPHSYPKLKYLSIGYARHVYMQGLILPKLEKLVVYGKHNSNVFLTNSTAKGDAPIENDNILETSVPGILYGNQVFHPGAINFVMRHPESVMPFYNVGFSDDVVHFLEGYPRIFSILNGFYFLIETCCLLSAVIISCCVIWDIVEDFQYGLPALITSYAIATTVYKTYLGRDAIESLLVVAFAVLGVSSLYETLFSVCFDQALSYELIIFYLAGLYNLHQSHQVYRGLAMSVKKLVSFGSALNTF